MESWRKKSDPDVIVGAIRVNEENVEALALASRSELIEEIDPEHPQETQQGFNLNSATGTMRVTLGMYLITYDGKFFAQHNRVFETVYEPVNRPAPPLESAGDTRKRLGFSDPFDQGMMT